MALSNTERKRLWELEVMTAAGKQNVVGDAVLGSVSVSPHPDDVDLVRVRWESITTMPRAEYDAIMDRRKGNLKTSPMNDPRMGPPNPPTPPGPRPFG
ncbi:hypothetical protein PBI_EDMUNDO_47 [Arthrobacter phage Edmundo]|nr:hypothetical protein PBI_EDMUNDO_47 [Arthrobacter phage Edmundo]